MDWQDGQKVRFRAGGATLEGQCFGPSPDLTPTFVLLHEGLGSISLWRDFPEELVKHTGMGVFVYSRLGYGNSDPVSLPRPLDYMNKEAEESLPDVIEYINPSQCILIGHSDGGSIAAIYAGLSNDDRLKAVILIAPHFFAEEISTLAISDARDQFLSGTLRQKLSRHHLDVDGAFCGWCEVWLDPQFQKWNIESFLQDIAVPALLIQGAQDAYGTCRQIRAFEEGKIEDNQVLLLSDCGHSPHQEKPAEVISFIKLVCDKYNLTG